MVFTAYLCDDFEMRDSGLLTIFGSYAEFRSNDSEEINSFIENYPHNAVVCPQLYVNEKGVRVKRVIFLYD